VIQSVSRRGWRAGRNVIPEETRTIACQRPMDLAAVIIAGLAFAVSAATLWRTVRRESALADRPFNVKAGEPERSTDGPWFNYPLMVTNKSPRTIGHIWVFIDDSADESTPSEDGDETLLPNERREFIVAVPVDCEPPLEARVRYFSDEKRGSRDMVSSQPLPDPPGGPVPPQT
jgi:hypothetical protein